MEHTSKALQAKELFYEGYNCAQSVFGVYCEELGIEKQTAMKLASSFGGGMGKLREVCGAVSGMFMVLGLLAGYDSPLAVEEKANHYARIQELAGQFKEKHGTYLCRELLANVETAPGSAPEIRDAAYLARRKDTCAQFIMDAVDILEEYRRHHLSEK